MDDLMTEKLSHVILEYLTYQTENTTVISL